MKKLNAYLVGIKGVAMTAMAVYLIESGYEVTGSDVDDIFPTDIILNKLNVKIKKGFKPENIDKKYDLVIVTGAHGGMTNIEAQCTRRMGLDTLMHGEMVGRVMNGKKGISVAGCHGKTTTSSIISHILTKSGLDPSYLVGTAEIPSLGPAGHYGKGDYIVVEADEYITCPLTDKTPRFLWQNPQFLVMTNIEYDHPDAYSSLDKVIDAFGKFAEKIPDDGLIIACQDNENTRKVISQAGKQTLTYGFSPRADFRISSFSFEEGLSFMKISYRNMDIGDFMLKIPGRHNLLNALASGIVANQVGIKWELVRKYLMQYKGSNRRFEKIGESGNILFFDDYAHHPSEIQATIKAARAWYQKRRIITIFQPHTFSRTKALLSDFARSFVGSNIAIVTDIYPSAREKSDSSISSRLLEIEMNKNKKNALYLKDKLSVLKFLDKNLENNDLIITMGAGDIYTWRTDINDLINRKTI